MSRKYVNFEITLIYLLLLIPWPQTHIIKILCSKDNSRLVRKIVRSKWTPILDKYSVKLPLECPLHPQRDIFAPRQDAKKRDRPTQWTCRLCGKSFYQEKFLDLHFETRHRSIINEAADAVCLADLCDIMRCDVFQSEEAYSLKIGDQHIVTDIEVWGDSLGQNSALAKANAAYLSLIPLRSSSSVGGTRSAKVQNRQLCQDKIGQNKFKDTVENLNNAESKATRRNTISSNEGGTSRKKIHSNDGSRATVAATTTTNTKSTKHHNAVNSQQTPPPTQSSGRTTSTTRATMTMKTATTTGRKRSHGKVNHNNDVEDGDDEDSEKNDQENATGSENRTQNGNSNMQRIRANCKAEDLNKFKAACEQLLHGCIGSLILLMSDQAFKEMEEEMNRAVCWYLSCDRYWEDGPLEPRAFPWGLLLILIFVLSTGICFCYYIIWILFDTEETTINANHHIYMYQHPYQQHLHQQQQPMTPQHQQQRQQQHQAVYATAGVHGGHHQGAPQPYYYQQSVRDLYHEPPQYDYRRSPRRYMGETHPTAITPTGATVTSAAAPVHGGTPLHHHPHQQQQHTPKQSHAYPQDILDRRDYISRPIATSAVTGVGSSGYGKTSSSASSSAVSAAAVNSASEGAVGGVRHYNTHPRPLVTHHRHSGASQHSLRTSASSHEIIQNDLGQNEHYIYVTYPPDLKKRYYDYDK